MEVRTSLRPRRPWWRILLASFAVLVLLGAAYESISEPLDLRRYPPPGKIVDMGGYGLHLDCTGEGSPTVILEAGLGGGVVTWPIVQPVVAKATRVCAYDRSAWAWSGGSVPTTGQETVARLHALLERAGEKGPYILVGHSLGGLYNQLYAASYPDEVAGMVLVEARHQDFAHRLSQSGLGSGSGASVVSRVASIANRLGLTRVMVHVGDMAGVLPKLPPGMMEMSIRPSSQDSAHAEERILETVEDEVRAAAITLGNKPLVVVTRDQSGARGKDDAVWMETQRLYLALSTNSRLTEAKGSNHMVPYDNPEAVTDAILDVLKASRP